MLDLFMKFCLHIALTKVNDDNNLRLLAEKRKKYKNSKAMLMVAYKLLDCLNLPKAGEILVNNYWSTD